MRYGIVTTRKKHITHEKTSRILRSQHRNEITQYSYKNWVHKMATLHLFHYVVYIDSKYLLQIQKPRSLFFNLITIRSIIKNKLFINNYHQHKKYYQSKCFEKENYYNLFSFEEFSSSNIGQYNYPR